MDRHRVLGASLVTAVAVGAIALCLCVPLVGGASPGEAEAPRGAGATREADAPPGTEESAEAETVLTPRPRSQRGVARLPRGDVLLLDFLQQLADASGERVAVPPGERPDATIILPRALGTLDLKTAREVLTANGLEIQAEPSSEAGERVLYRVQRGLTRPGTRGRIIMPGEEVEPADDARAPVPRRTAAPKAAEPRLYALEEGDGGRYLVVVECDSRKEAEDVLALLRARRSLR